MRPLRARVRGDDDAWTTFDDEDARETSAEEVVGGAAGEGLVRRRVRGALEV